jgi:REP element-mobilizing transposase RayT
MNEPPLKLGACALARPEVAIIVEDALLFFHEQRYILVAWCVMPNHVHAAFTVLAGNDAPDILHSWKSYTAHKANRSLRRHGTFWERESFDHLIRSLADFEYFVHYVENNPVAAGLAGSPQDWRFSSAYSACGGGVPPAPPDRTLAPPDWSAGGTPAPQTDGRD